MHWYFERSGQRMRWEIRRATEGEAYELALQPPDGPEAVERFDNPTELIERALRFQQSLLDDGWRPAQTQGDDGPPAPRAVSPTNDPRRPGQG